MPKKKKKTKLKEINKIQLLIYELEISKNVTFKKIELFNRKKEFVGYTIVSTDNYADVMKYKWNIGPIRLCKRND